MQTYRVRWLAVSLLAVVSAGCGDNKGTVTRLNPRGVPYLEGVPVPNGFKLEKGESTDFESAGQRNARHVYSGFGDASRVRSFYQEQMPLMGWTRVSAQNVEGNITLRFEKKTEACTIEIRPTQFLDRTRVHVTVSPFDRSAQPQSEPPGRPVP